MNTVKPVFEKVTPSYGSSFKVAQYSKPNPNRRPTWHVHPEVELVYIRNGQGKRQIGSHISWYKNGDLILIGSNLPHMGLIDRLSGNNLETVVQLGQDFLGDEFLEAPEMLHVKNMFDRAAMGIVFQGITKTEIGARIEQLVQLDPMPKLIHLLSILDDLALSEEYEVLNINGVLLEVSSQEQMRFNKIYTYVRGYYDEIITLDDIAEQVNMTVPAFCRYFKKTSGKTFITFLNEYRVMKACSLLGKEHLSISEVCFASGFNSISQFNRIFKEITGMSPSIQRNEFKQVIK